MRHALATVRGVLQTLPALALLLIGSTPVFAHEGAIGNEVMWQACEDRRLHDRCAFRNADHDTYRGSCQSIAGHLVCVRNQPVERAAANRAQHAHVERHHAGLAATRGHGLAYGTVTMAFLALGGVAFAFRSERRGGTNARSGEAERGGAPAGGGW